MLLTKASEYALLCIVEFAKASESITADFVAEELQLSKSFTAKILQSLAKDEILHSYKGVNGGFRLCDGYKSISLKTVLESAEKKSIDVFECSSGKECPSSKVDCQVLPVLQLLQFKLDGFLENLKISDLIGELQNER